MDYIIDVDTSNLFSYWLLPDPPLIPLPHAFDAEGNVVISNLVINVNSSSNVFNNAALELDLDVVFDNCTILFSDGSGLIVKSEVISSGSTFDGCNGTWNRIYVPSGGTFSTNSNTEINNADTGVRSLDSNRCSFSNTAFSCNGGRGIIAKSEVSLDNVLFNNCSIGTHAASFGSSSISNSNFDNCLQGIIVGGNCDIFDCTFANTSASESIAIYCGAGVTSISGNTIQDYETGIELSKANLSNIISNDISTIAEGIIIRDNSNACLISNYITSSGSANPQIGDTISAVVSLNASNVTLDNNIIEKDGVGSGVAACAMNQMSIINNDITGGGNFWGVLPFPAIYNSGTMPGAIIDNNVIDSYDAPGIQNLNSSGQTMTCNDIVSDGGIFGNTHTAGIWNGFDSDEAFLQGNILQSTRDLITYSTIQDPSHLGNCFNGERAEAVGYNLQDLQILDMIFNVDPSVRSCYQQDNHQPQGWFRAESGTAQDCIGGVGSGVGSSLDDTTRICRLLEYLDGQLQDTTRRDLAIMRLISLFRMYNDSTITEELVVPDCMKIYLDTTSLCGIKMLLTMDSLIDSTLGSDTLRFQIQVQSTLTYLTLMQWRNYVPNGEEGGQMQKDSLRQVYIRHLTALRTLVQTVRNDSDRIWTEIDSIQILSCLDSISMIEMMAIKYMARDSLTEEDRSVIDGYARRCAQKYGRGIHVMRAIAASFSKEDYRQYDYDCDEPREDRPLEQRARGQSRTLSVVPNPSYGQLTVTIPDHALASSLSITDLVGTSYYETSELSSSIQINLDESGIYLAQVKYKDGTYAIEKFIVIE